MTSQPPVADRPPAVAALVAAYGDSSDAGFGSAVFSSHVERPDQLESAALEHYRHFVGGLWERYGEAAWMGPWSRVYTRPDGTRDVLAELASIADASARSSAGMVLDGTEDPETARRALVAVFDDPGVAELAVWRLGDGEALSGVLIAGRRASGETTFLVFLLD